MPFSEIDSYAETYVSQLLTKNLYDVNFKEFALNCIEDITFTLSVIDEEVLDTIITGTASKSNDFFIDTDIIIRVQNIAGAIKTKLSTNNFELNEHYIITNDKYMINYHTFKMIIFKSKLLIELCNLINAIDDLYKYYLLEYKCKTVSTTTSFEHKKPAPKKKATAVEFTHYAVILVDEHGGGEYEYYIVRGTSVDDIKMRASKKHMISYLMEPRAPTYKDINGNESVSEEISKIKKYLTKFRKENLIDMIRADGKLNKLPQLEIKEKLKLSNLPFTISQTKICLKKNDYISLEIFTECFQTLTSLIDDEEDIAPETIKKSKKVETVNQNTTHVEEDEEIVDNTESTEDDLINNL